ncbi:RNA polymerase sigma factor FliA [Enterobacter cloacae]|mgnify:FL=1|uniref:RNA polymerase sigma factor for flagellar operon FliA n=2 Tax=Enterobacter cloacae TaxID=550 RepID=A0A0H3CMF1_ENTCC|nr:RNA polymerase sigma factor FliA [Enterobacter cloacae]MBW4207253.1 RNA polymerase sigma factor FliA [Enterobacter cloacae subsp. cloacae]ADF62799.1 RNA polymerase sigma factor for flagellar operon FliA [Enterobacter cloacae subsp. cloacae ATCC 13047]KGB11628.1 RNA polymerase sigma factor for flagellar operon [Enterobacter cloacae]MBW4227756.1 RNA polymerase sigma factor FliA [Enterobacter cloacae subsp. cloacae]MCJ8537288.1 RNA polymerase sigma factor FliA [Enterobacter cloacae]
MDGIYTAEGLENKSVVWSKYHYLVRQEALRLHKRLPASVELDDLIQAGSIGFLSAVESFDPKKGVTLTAWISQRVKWALLDELRESDWVPRRVRTHTREIVALIQQIEQEKGGEATEAEIAERMGVSLQEFQQMLADNNASQMYSVDELQENYADSWETSDEENEQLNPLNDAVRQNLMERITEHIQVIPEREQVLLQLYYLQDLNMKEIGLILGITETRVSQLHSLAVKRLRSRMESSSK